MLAFPIGTTRPQRRKPWVNIAIIALNVIIFLLSHRDAPGPMGDLAPGFVQYMLFPRPFLTQIGGHLVTCQPMLYQFITYQFLHAGWSHLLGNMLFLYVFGNNLNEKLGHVGYLAFYLAGGVLAGCGQALTSSDPTLGASGSISAVTGMFLALLPRTEIKLFVWLWFFFDVFVIPSMWFILFMVIKDIVEPFLGPSEVAHMAHLAGSLAGFGVGMLLLGAGLIQRDHYDMLALLDRWRRRKQYEALVSRGFDPFGRSVGGIAAGTAPLVVVDPRVAGLRDEIGGLLRGHNLPTAAAKYLELRKLDPNQVLPEPDQLDVGNQLMSEGKYETAAAAYEDYLKLYRLGSHREQVELILGLIYARYLPRTDRALELLKGVLVKLHDKGQRAMAEEELARLQARPAG